MPDWRVISAGCEDCRNEISSESIKTPCMVDFFGGAPGTVDCLGGAPGKVYCLGGAAGNALSSLSFEISTYGCDTALEECGTDWSAVIT
jgi:hypothetical protein